MSCGLQVYFAKSCMSLRLAVTSLGGWAPKWYRVWESSISLRIHRSFIHLLTDVYFQKGNQWHHHTPEWPIGFDSISGLHSSPLEPGEGQMRSYKHPSRPSRSDCFLSKRRLTCHRTGFRGKLSSLYTCIKGNDSLIPFNSSSLVS